MKEPLILKTDEQPTIFNKEMVIGTLIAPGLGTIVGGYIGKQRMEREAISGKIMDKPSLANKDALLGWLAGGLVGGIAALVLATTAPALALVAMIATPVVGAVIGARRGKETQGIEYAQALAQKNARESERGQTKYVVFENERANGKSYGADILAERLRAANQQKEV